MLKLQSEVSTLGILAGPPFEVSCSDEMLDFLTAELIGTRNCRRSLFLWESS